MVKVTCWIQIRLQKLSRCFIEKVNFFKIYKTNKLAIFYYTKDPIKLENKAYVVYRITCSGYFNKCIGKTYHNLISRLDEHDTKPEKQIYEYLSICDKFNNSIKLVKLPHINGINIIVIKEIHLPHLPHILSSYVVENVEILDYSNK